MKLYKIIYDDFELKTIMIMAKGKLKALNKFMSEYGTLNQILDMEEME